MTQTIGILALQGDFDKHRHMVRQLGHQAILVKDESDLQQCDKLIIPGGESTTLLHLIERMNLRESLLNFGQSKSVMGTCAGLILLGTTREHLPGDPLGLIDVKVKRNAYGRQVDSFVDTITLRLDGDEEAFEGVFIRAPQIQSCGAGVRVLGYHGKQVVMAANERILVCTFHPELTDDLRLHRFFITQM